MALTCVSLFVLFFLSFGSVLQTSCILNDSVLKTPAVYAFGDSAIDAGNNKFIPNATARFNFMPYGIDFLGGIPTGRTTNGKTIVDFIAESAGLPFPPPMLSLSKAQLKSTRTGVNFGSSSSGIQRCRPVYLHRVSHSTSCVEDVNQRVATFNDLLPNMLMELEKSLKGSTFILCDLHKLFEEVHAQPEAYGRR
ncbi:hypothetical protein V6N12_032560 [Hibiscus sabdariffa]|uniref:GDSL esterase/lipase n=1 Tax=Hibiscus sabdariffa TaxID=183260 RepID=A0ABR2CD03_9ROSI